MLKSTFQHLQSHMTEHLSKQFVNILEKSVFVGETNTANGFITHIKSILTEELKNLMDGQVGCLSFLEIVSQQYYTLLHWPFNNQQFEFNECCIELLYNIEELPYNDHQTASH